MKVPASVRAAILAAGRTSFDATVPIPPSVNNLYATVGRRRVKTKEYAAWLKAALPAMERMRVATEFPVRVVVSIFGPVNSRRDIDNCHKAASDALVLAGVIPGDSIGAGVWEAVQRYYPDGGPVALVQVERVHRG